jgi:hypothetical protein
MLGKAFDSFLRDLPNTSHQTSNRNIGDDVFSNPKSKLKLLSAVERLRKVLSGLRWQLTRGVIVRRHRLGL